MYQLPGIFVKKLTNWQSICAISHHLSTQWRSVLAPEHWPAQWEALICVLHVDYATRLYVLGRPD